jgi:voltage-gated potassium channel Kch
MLQQIALGSLLTVITTCVHTFSTLAILWALSRTHSDRFGISTRRGRVMLVAALVLMLFIAALLEVGIWAAAYLAVGALSALEPAIYFSMVTFTTLGYGDVVLPEAWRLLASFEAANGILMFGWSTALLFAVVHRVASHEALLSGRDA